MECVAKKINDEEIIKIYEEEYIGMHLGIPTLKKKYNYNKFYEDFVRLNLKRRNNQEKNRKYNCDETFFDNIDSEEKAYWFGFIYADGYIGRSKNNAALRLGISITESDSKHLEKFQKAINTDTPIHHYSVVQGYKTGSKYCRIIISNDHIARSLIAHGCIEHKSNIIEPPIGIPEELERHFIRGFMDGNGSVARSNTKYGYEYNIKWVSTDAVLLWIMHHLIKNNILNHEYPLYKRKKEHIISSFEFGGNYLAKKYLDYIYQDATVWLDRKYDRYIDLSNLLKEKEDRKIHRVCDICGDTTSSNYCIWHREGDYQNKVVCRKHYLQLRKNNKIIPDRKKYCELCGDTIGSMHRVGRHFPKYYGITMCKKHYDQLTSGKTPDKIRGIHKNGK